MSGAADAQSIPVTVSGDLSYGNAPAQNLMYCAPNAPGGGPAPALMLVHGGGWYKGDKSDYGRLCRKIAGYGVIAVPVNYRLVDRSDPQNPKNTWSIQLSDLQLAVRWLRANLPNFSGKICARGESAGAHLAVWLGALKTVASGDENAASFPDLSPSVDCVVANSVPTNLTKARPTPYGQDSVDAFVDYPHRGAQGLRDASAVPYKITPQMSPTFITHGTRDSQLPMEQPQELVDALKANGVTYQFRTYRGGHAFANLAAKARQAIEQREIKWVMSYIGHQ